MRSIFAAALAISVPMFAGSDGVDEVIRKQLSAAVSDKSCEFYDELESVSQCGKKGYPLKIGQHYCKKYLKSQPSYSEGGQTWLKSVRQCLQTQITLMDELSCKSLYKESTDMHFECYVSTGYCDLSFGDQAKIAKEAALMLFMPEYTRFGLKIASYCRAMQKLDHLR